MIPQPAPRRVRVRLDIAYDGAGFRGWALQPGLRTVAAELGTVLARHRVGQLVPAPPVCAGRTDAGVHARGQVAHTDLGPATAPVPGSDVPAGLVPTAADLDAALFRWRRALPPDIELRGAAYVHEDFDARFAALWRRYAYRLADPPAAADPLTRGWVLRWPRPLDIAAMAAAGALLLGEHDFTAYCRRREGASTVRTLLDCSTVREPAGTVRVSVRADAFCRQMVRSLVGALVEVGAGRRAPTWPRAVLDARRRDAGYTVASAHGLVLEEVGYPPAEQWARRARVARAFRG